MLDCSGQQCSHALFEGKKTLSSIILPFCSKEVWGYEIYEISEVSYHFNILLPAGNGCQELPADLLPAD